MPTLVITSDPPKIAVFGESIITARARDASGQPVPAGRVIELGTNIGLLLETAPETDSQGIARTRLRGDGRVGTARVSGQLRGSSASAVLDVAIGEGVTVDVRAQPAAVVRRGASTITVRASRGDGSTIPGGTRVALASTLGTITPNDLPLDSFGVATATFTAGATDGTAEITASIAGEGEGRVLVIVGGDPSISLEAAPSSIPTDGRAELFAVVSDPSGAPLAGAEVELTTTLGSIEGPRPRTDNAGIARSALLAAGASGEARVAARVVGTQAHAMVAVQLGASVRLSLTANPQTISSTGEALLGIAVVGPNGEAMAGLTVDLTTTAGALGTSTLTTNSLGLATSSLRANGFVGVVRVSATARGTSASDSVDIVVQP